MAEESRVFDQHVADWKAWQDAPWGRLRYSMAHANLQRHLEGTPLRVLDVGGGNGVESLLFAAQGHAVTIIDYSAEMLAAAQRAAETAGVSPNTTLIEADVTTVPELVAPGSFDLVLCHNVLQYLSTPETTVQQMGALLRPGGLLSLICPNPASEAYRLALQQDLAGALDQLDATTACASMFGVTVERYRAEELIPWMQSANCRLLGHYGIRCLCDYLPDNERKADPAFFATLERLEYALSDRHPYYLLARFFHLIGQRSTDATMTSTT